MKLALLGLGKMGIEVGGQLLRSGHSLTVFNRTAARAQPLLDQGARLASTPAQAVANCEIALTAVLDDGALRSITEGPDGVLAGLPKDAIHAGLSTISVVLARELATAHTARGQHYASIPMLGRPDAARERRLVMIAGGDPATLDRLEPVLTTIGRTTFVAGPEPWHGNLFKLCSNFMISGVLEAFGEAQAVVRKANLDPTTFVALASEFFASPIYRNYGTLMVEKRFSPPGGTLALGLKDNGLLLDAAGELQAPMPLASLVRDQMLAAMAAGFADVDWTSLGTTAQRNAGLA
jgi:3-hydroxyisobutyrate dehydrogenase-like beta-hydroxyacid dehydrogenase